MKNATSITRLALLHPNRRQNFQNAIEDAENQLTDIESLLIVQEFRSFAEQDALYAQGRTTPGNIVTRAKGGQSWHCYGLAIDVVPIVNGKADWDYDYSKINAVFETYGLTWGASWHDNDHFEDNCGQGASGWHWALDKYNAGDMTGGYINL